MAARSDNRQLNAALYRIAMTQIKRDGPAKAYYRKRRDAGDSHSEALRRVERRVARRVFGHLRADTTWAAEGGPLTGEYAAGYVFPSVGRC